MCYQVDIPVSVSSLVQRSTTDCGVSECDPGALAMRTPMPTGDCRLVGEKTIGPVEFDVMAIRFRD